MYLSPISVATLSLTSDNHLVITYVASLVWGYHFAVDRWLKWLENWPSDQHLINSATLLRWNTRKTYLNELSAAQVPIIPTLFVDDGPITPQMLRDAASSFGEEDELVIKPQISAGGDNTQRIALNSSSLPTIETISPMMIQPFLKSICNQGEISVYIADGKVSHVLVKHPAENDFRAIPILGGWLSKINEPTDEILAVVAATLAACPERPIYARVDMVRDNLGVLNLMELELIEPFLCLNYANDSGLSFARALLNYNH